MSLERDSRGFIWLGTQDGTAVFNGYNFTVINMPNRAVSNYIYDILAAKDGSIWFSTSNGGIHRYYNGQWKTFDKATGLASNETRALFESFDKNGEQVIWIGRRDGLSRLAGDKVENFDTKDGLPDKRVRSIIETTDKEGKKTLWIGTYGGVAVWHEDHKTIFDDKSGLPGNVVFNLMETTNEKEESVIWAGTNKGLAKYENGQWTTFGSISDILTKTVRGLGKSFKADGTMTVWVGFDGQGLAYLEKGKWEFLNQEKGLPNDLAFGFAPTGAADGSVWISNLGQGVSRFERSNWRSFNKTMGLPNDIVFSMAETVSKDGETNIWFGTFGGGLTTFSNGNWLTYDKSNGLTSDFVQTLFSSVDEDGNSVLYVGLENGLMVRDRNRWRQIDLNNGKGQPEVWDIKEYKTDDGQKKLLLATSLGLVTIVKDEVKILNTSNGLPDNNLRSTLETTSKDGLKTVWIATYNAGLVKLINGDVTVIDKNKGLLTNRIYSVSEINYGSSNKLWVGTGGGGIVVFDLDDPDKEFETITTENSNLLPSDTVYQIFQDSKKRIYATTNKGVARITPTNGGNLLGFDSYFFTTEDGLPNNECTLSAGFIDSKNRVWAGTVSGASVLDLSKEFTDETAEPLFLQNVFIDDKKTTLEPNTNLSYDQNNLVFEYVMPTNFRESATVYQTQMIGLEDKPTEWTKEPRREFTFIPSGDFTFKVWGKDASGNISKPLEIPFTIRPAWWLTWWAVILYFLTTIAIVSMIAFLIYRNRYRRMLEIERVRTRIATDLHDDVGSSLSKISIISEVLAHSSNGFAEDDKNSLNMIANTSREVVGSMSDMVWSINPNRDNLRDTVQRMRRFANEVLSAKGIKFKFDTPDDEREIKLDVDLRRQIYLVFKESINNCAKYSECTEVKAELKRKTDGIYLNIKDNGKGFDINSLERGNGLVNMRKRAEEMGGYFTVKSEQGKGTEISLKLPRRLGGFAFPKAT
jgi:ligand-binding sensor domain-containing protein/two-component sensor histidine kinase